MFRGERGLCPRNQFLGGGFGRGAKPPSEFASEVKRKKPVHARVRKPMPAKPPKVEIPKTAYRRRPKHVRPPEPES